MTAPLHVAGFPPFFSETGGGPAGDLFKPAVLPPPGARSQERLADLGLLPYRIEITSALRTAEQQARLRRNNANAAAGVISHEFGTTVDLSYAAFAPPAKVPEEIIDGVPEDLRPHIRRIADLAFDSVSARKSRELGRIFGHVLAEAQDEGIALVIYERQQTVYHLTMGRAMEWGGSRPRNRPRDSAELSSLAEREKH